MVILNKLPQDTGVNGGNMPKIALVDLDGVLNNYDGRYSENEIPQPKNDVENFLVQLSKTYEIHIFTVRNKNLTNKWLQKHNLDKYIKEVTNIKNPFASIIIDDRAINFNGNFDEVLKKAINFQPYWKR